MVAVAGRNDRVAPFVSEVPRVSVSDSAVQRGFNHVITTLAQLVKFLDPFVRPVGWEKPTWGAGWQDYTVALDTYQNAAFKKDPLGRVHLRGLVERASGVGTTIMLLPAGHRPAKQKIFVVLGSGGVGRVDIQEDGAVVYVSGGVTFLSLEGISFDTES